MTFLENIKSPKKLTMISSLFHIYMIGTYLLIILALVLQVIYDKTVLTETAIVTLAMGPPSVLGLVAGINSKKENKNEKEEDFV